MQHIKKFSNQFEEDAFYRADEREPKLVETNLNSSKTTTVVLIRIQFHDFSRNETEKNNLNGSYAKYCGYSGLYSNI